MPPLEAQREIHFVDPRPPHEIQFQLEKTLLILFEPRMEGPKLTMRALAKMTSCPFSFDLTFESTFPEGNFYTFRMHASWDRLPETNHDYYKRSTAGWFDYWAKPFRKAPLPAGAGLETRYRELMQQALTTEANLPDVGSIQQAILAGMRGGAYFVTAHKEGGTHLRWKGTHFERADYGEGDEVQTFADEASFLAFLRQFYKSEVVRQSSTSDVTEFTAWKLILRLLEPVRA